MESHYLRMLHLARKIQPHFRGFYLAGGTSLMLRHRHRISVDLDFFHYSAFSFARLIQRTQSLFTVSDIRKGEDNLDVFIEDVRVSFVHFPFKNIKPLERFEGITIASDYDIFLNKIYAAGRRIDPKDPVDAAFLYNLYKWDKGKIKKDFERKFTHQSYELFLGALLNFEDYPNLSEDIKKTLVELLE